MPEIYIIYNLQTIESPRKAKNSYGLELDFLSMQES